MDPRGRGLDRDRSGPVVIALDATGRAALLSGRARLLTPENQENFMRDTLTYEYLGSDSDSDGTSPSADGSAS